MKLNDEDGVIHCAVVAFLVLVVVFAPRLDLVMVFVMVQSRR